MKNAPDTQWLSVERDENKRLDRSYRRSGGVELFEAELRHDGRGNFLDRLRRRIEPADAFAGHQAFGVGDFLTAVLDAGVAAVRTALVANFGKALGLDGEAEELFAKRNAECGRLYRPAVLRN